MPKLTALENLRADPGLIELYYIDPITRSNKSLFVKRTDPTAPKRLQIAAPPREYLRRGLDGKPERYTR